MSDEVRHALRELGPEESALPGRAWIEKDGIEVELTLNRTGPDTWEAAPPAPCTIGPGDHLCVDRLPAGHTVAFLDVAYV